MGNPAARMGDTTSHGGVIVKGLPTVLIGKLPAARMGDMHVCPMVTPGTPPVPHVGGPILLGSKGVFIGGVPAARVGDTAFCTGPPDAIAMGCTTVLIGETGSGGGGSAGPAASNAGAAMATSGGGREGPEGHWLDFRFVDSAGLPVRSVVYELERPDGRTERGKLSADGRARCAGLTQTGNGTVRLCGVFNAQWSAHEADAGETLTLSADVWGFADGTAACITVCERDLKGADHELQVIDAEVGGEALQAEWTYPHPQERRPYGARTGRGYSSPVYYFIARVGSAFAVSDLLMLRDWIEIELKDDRGRAIPDEDYVVYLPDGSVRRGTLDGAGKARVENVPPRACRVVFPNVAHMRELPNRG